MNIIDEAAAIINPDAFSPGEWVNEKGEPFALMKSRRAYLQSQARHRASEVLKLAARAGAGLAELLAQIEIDGWQMIGVPVRSIPGAEAIVRAKYVGQSS